ncbi:MAG: ABC transporter permease [Acidobacteriia bacterium]|nr:ABC transporter permease [Terriglobia bacterium]
MKHWFYTVPLRFRSLFRSQQVENELDEELQYHLEKKVEEYIGQGLTPEQSRQAALRAMDGLTQRKEECRDMRGVNGIENVLQDTRYGLRMLAKSPGFTAVAVLTLALGIGANTAIFSVINTVLLEPLQYPDPDRIVQLMLFSPAWAAGKNANTASVTEFNVLREQRQSFDEIAAYDTARGVNLTGVESPEQLRAIHVTASYFPLFGAHVVMGRAFTADEDRPGGPHLALITDGLWHRRFAGDRSPVGKALLLGGAAYTVIGVLDPTFAAEDAPEILLPLQADPESTNGGHTLRVAARLRPGITLAQAKVQLKLAYDQFLHKFPNRVDTATRSESFTAEPLWDTTVGEVRRPLLVLAGAVGFVLLIACTNVANLLLARATGRRREMTIRAALGASRGRIVSQLLIESVLLSLAGGAVGLLFGDIGVRALMAIRPGGMPRIGSAITLDAPVLAFTLLLSISTGILFGILPAFGSASQLGAGAGLPGSGTRAGTGIGQSRTRSLLVIAEVALALILLTGAGLLIRTFWALRTVDPGFDAHNILTLEMSLAGTDFEAAPVLAEMIRDAERRIESLPGVVAAAATYSLPLEFQLGGPVAIEGLPNDRYGANMALVSRHYFDVFRIPLRQGRSFTDRDDEHAPAVTLINQAMAEGRSEGMRWSSTFPWRNANPLEERVTMAKGNGPPFEDRTRQIVGVVGEVRDAGLNRKPIPMLYMPIAQLTDGNAKMSSRGLPLRWAIRTRAEPLSLRADIERELRAASGGLPVAHIRSMEQVVGEATSRDRFNMILLSVFAGIALLLGAIGVYGLMAYAVQHRTQEIGIRIALGARPRDVRLMVVLEGMRLALSGVVLGVAGALELTPLMGSLLFGVHASDPVVLASTAFVLSTAAFLATYIPAHRATRVDPVLALRWE